MSKTVYMLGYASDIAAAHQGTGDGPSVLQQSPYMKSLVDIGLNIQWQALLKPASQPSFSKNKIIAELNQELAAHTHRLVADKKFFTVVGGDHSSAIGTWSGVAKATQSQGEIGLIWIDAHMDSHTPETSPSGNIHGMPLACLLGYGEESLTHILTSSPKFKPENICMIGIRSYEPGEAELLKRLNVRIFFMEEVDRRGLDAVMADALEIATRNTIGFGVTIDIDGIDPQDAPGTGVAEENGIRAKALCAALKPISQQPSLLGIEIVEFDPHRDKNHLTEKLVPQLMAALTLGKEIA